MKTFNKVLFFFIIAYLIYSINPAFTQVKIINDGKYPYTIVENDPLKTRIYKLENGLTVYITVYKNEPRIQTFIPVKAGSKMDPSDATGLAHYLEHMLFKGTDKFGTKDYEKEKPLIDEIINLYEIHKNTKDEKKRKEIYRKIDSVSNLASKYAIANEYDKMMNIIGATGTNAYTSVEQTVYTNNIPSNQLEKWIKIEAERFRNPVMRLFHTELETVYEEKNISLDNDDSKAWETLMANLFPTHQYGTQTTIGTIEHLKNPSIKTVIDYYNKYYVPNNMAIVLSGDLDPDKTIELIDKYWGYKEPKNVPKFYPAKEKPITKPIEKNVYGPEAEYVTIGYRFPGVNSYENDMIYLIDLLLANNNAGLMDLNLIQNQKVLGAGSYTIDFKDYSAHVLYGNPREGQKLEEVKKLLLDEIERIKKGEFENWLIEAVINDLKLSEIKSQESNRSRAGKLVNSFVKDIPWENSVNRINRLSKITKQEIINFANEHYSDNYVVVYKRTGEDKNVVKIQKPEITPVEVNRKDKSKFLQEISETQIEEIKPVFIDYKTDLSISEAKFNIPIIYKQNTENELFYLTINFEIGEFNNKLLPLASDYFEYLGTDKFSPAKIKEEFYKLGCSYTLQSSSEETSLTLTGLNENFDKAFIFLQNIIENLIPNSIALENLIADIIKVRADNKLNKETILWDAMFSYGKFGSKSPFTDIISESELKNIKPSELISLIQNLPSFKQKILYYGPLSLENLKNKINSEYSLVKNELIPAPEPVKYEELNTDQNKIYIVNYPDMVQAEILMLSKKNTYNKDLIPIITMYNEYFGGGMSGIVFQEIRESKALAYSSFSSYTSPSKLNRSHYNIAYIGTQADKLTEALPALINILNDLPLSELTFNTGKENLIQKINTERITKSAVLSNYLSAQKLGLEYDIRKDIYNNALNYNLDDVKKFHDEYIKDSKYTILILGDINKLNIDFLKQYGELKILSMEDIFGY